jgi:hypothetical protein
MLWLFFTVGFAGFSILALRGPVENQLKRMHAMKLAKLETSKKTLKLEARVSSLEVQVAETIIKNHDVKS